MTDENVGAAMRPDVGVDAPEQWRGRMRLIAAERTVPRRNAPLTEAERESIDIWVPKGATILAYSRGRLTREGCPVWVLTTQGALITTLNDVGFSQIKARADWIPASHLRRIDLDVEGEFALVRIVSASRRYVLYSIDRDSAVRFVAMTRAAIAANVPSRGPRSALREAVP